MLACCAYGRDNKKDTSSNNVGIMAQSSARLVSQEPIWKELAKHAEQDIAKLHLRDLVQDGARDALLVAEYDGILLDFSRQRVTDKTMNLLFGTQAGLRSIRSHFQLLCFFCRC